MIRCIRFQEQTASDIELACASIYSTTSILFDLMETGKIVIKTKNNCEDKVKEVLLV